MGVRKRKAPSTALTRTTEPAASIIRSAEEEAREVLEAIRALQCGRCKSSDKKPLGRPLEIGDALRLIIVCQRCFWSTTLTIPALSTLR